MAKEVVLLGGSGFIGKALSVELKNNGQKTNPLSSKDIDLLKDESSTILRKMLSPSSILVITAAINRELGDNLITLHDNITMMKNVARALEETDLALCIYFSTADVYGQPDVPISEETPLNPQTYYATSKLACEFLLRVSTTRQGIPLLTLRIDGVYGPGQRSNKYGPNSFIHSILNNAPAEVWGDGEETRSILYVCDLARIVRMLLEKKVTGLINIATPETTTFSNVISILRKIHNKDFDINYKDRTGPKFDQSFNIARLTKELPNIHFTPLNEGLRTTYAALKNTQAYDKQDTRKKP